MQVRVRYHRAVELAADWDAQLARGGMLVRAEPKDAACVTQFEPATLVIEATFAGMECVQVDAQVVQVFPGVGVAVTFAPSPALADLASRAREAGTAPGDARAAAAEHSVLEPGDAAHAATETANPVPAPSRTAGTASIPEKVAMALRGNRDERTAVLREQNPTLHTHVLRNPGLQLDEVLAIAKMRTVSSELLKLVAERREWFGRPDIALALVRNPKTPAGIAIKLLDFVPPTDLRQLAKDTHVRTPIQQAARKKVIG